MVAQDKNYFPHEADIGIIGHGKTVTEAFCNAAEATFAIMTDIEHIKPLQLVEVEFEEEDIELALVTWLNSLIAEAIIQGLIFSHFELTKNNNHWQGKAWGEPLSKNLLRGTEVKGATLTMLSVKNINGQWEARCVVDV